MSNETSLNDEYANLLVFWGKTGSQKADPNCYHPLLFHLLDVGNVCLYLWRYVLPEQVKHRIAATLGVSVAEAKVIIVLLAAQHDTGKLSSFQYKSEQHVKTVLGSGLHDISSPNQHPHGYVTTKVLRDIAVEGIGGWQATKSVAEDLARITGGHHGTFPNGNDLSGMGSATVGGKDWKAKQRKLLEALPHLLFPGAEAMTIAISQATLEDAVAVPLIGGLISVADWIASSQEQDCFPVAFTDANKNCRPTVTEYVEISRNQAKSALERFGWTPTPQFAQPTTFGDLFQDGEGKPFVSNAMQEEAVRRADNADEPYLMIIEEEMGAGKTEAAVYGIDRALTTGLANGFYIALPTQATGNQMFSRVLNYLRKRGHGGNLNYQLVHSGNFLDKQFDELQRKFDAPTLTAISGDDRADEEEGRVVAEGWFTFKKRPLLAPFGVGTIDQTLLGVLQTRHWFVRLFGLAGKVVVFDEVHAYDVYTGALLVRLLSWLRAIGCTVILLSATLPEAKRKELVKAWDAGVEPKESAYPRITFVQGENAEAVCVAPKIPEKPKTVVLERRSCDVTELPKQICQALPEGGCAAIICNTVARAQETFRTIRTDLESKGWKVILFHARTPAIWRKEREEEVLKLFGKGEGKYGENANRPGRAVLIATQVIEQSLDLDFEFMISEMAPIDLLLQRMGRLWRHKRTDRNKYVIGPRFCLLCDENSDSLPRFPEFTELVYDRYTLLRSYLALREKTAITIPNDIASFIHAVYDTPFPTDIGEIWTTAIKNAEAESRSLRIRDAKQARLCLVKNPDVIPEEIFEIGSDAGTSRMDLLDDEDPAVHPTVRAATRLGDPSVSVICYGTDTDGRPLANIKGVPDREQARQLLRFGISLSQRGLVPELTKLAPPTSWKKSAYLRYHRKIEFDNGVAEIAGRKLHLSLTEGLVVERQGKTTEE